MSPARSPPKLRTQCPYCEHVSPADSKFCNECGAALHLVPCPHCGAVNDLTLTDTCARCNGDLLAARSDRPPKALTLVSDPPTLNVLAAEDVQPQAPAEDERDALPPHPPASRPPLPTLGVAGLVVLAALAYFFYTPGPATPPAAPAPTRPIVAAPAPVPSTARATTPEIASAPAPAPEEARVAAAEPAPASTPAVTQETPTVTPKASAPGRRLRQTAAAAAAAEAPDNAAPRRDAGPVEPPPPRIGPCTDAVAALGLCSKDPTPRRQ